MIQVSDTINRSTVSKSKKKTTTNASSGYWFTRFKPQHFNFNELQGYKTNQQISILGQYFRYIFSVLQCRFFFSLLTLCVLFVYIALYIQMYFYFGIRAFVCACVWTTQMENFKRKSRERERKENTEKNVWKVFMLCVLFSLRMVKHVAAKLKCHTSAYNLYDVYVTGMFL